MPLATETPVELMLFRIWRPFDEEIATLTVFDAVFVFPIESLNTPDDTATDPDPAIGPVAVNVTVRVVPDVVSEERVPRVVVKSASTRSLTLSLSVMVMVHDVPAA